MRIAVLASILILVGCAHAPRPAASVSMDLFDVRNGRTVPVVVHQPAQGSACLSAGSCPVAFISPGYGNTTSQYSELVSNFVEHGFLAVEVTVVLPNDPPIPKSGDPRVVRMPAWKLGAQSLRYAREELKRRYPAFAWSRLVLVGHSHGGDVAALADSGSEPVSSTLITLDNRRFPLPVSEAIRVLSLRGIDFEADPGVLPAGSRRNARFCVLVVPGARHDEMTDAGPASVRAAIRESITGFLQGDCRLPQDGG